MTREAKEISGREQAIIDFERLVANKIMHEGLCFDGFRVIGNPFGGKYAKERKISLLRSNRKVIELRCGYGSYFDCAYFNTMLDKVTDVLKTVKTEKCMENRQ